MTSGESLLEIKDLSVDYHTKAGKVRAVDHVSLGVKNGQAMGIVGESGCGKTTLALSILRILPDNAQITDGSVLFEGQDLVQMKAARLRRIRWKDISMVFQGALNALNPVFPIGDQLADIVQLHEGTRREEARERAARAFEMVGLDPELRWSYPHELSGGMRQRAIIAMALLLNPKLLIADEPTTALDVVIQSQIIEEIKSLQRRLKLALILITHDISIVAQTCGELAVMYGGRMMELGPTREIFQHPRNPYTLSLLSAYPPLHGERRMLAGLPGSPPDLLHPPEGCWFAQRCFMVQPKCTKVEPDMLPVFGDAWSSRCHFVGDVPKRLPGGL